MRTRWLAGASVAAVVAGLIVAPIALADTCCANTSVTFAPPAAEPRDKVRVDGLTCLDADNSGPLPLNLVSFWLSADDIPADPSPGDVPGNPDVHLADDLPPVERWMPFRDVSGTGDASSGSATIVIPDLPRGTYQLWWRCNNGAGPGSGVHYSGGPRLKVAGPPDTSTVGSPGTPGSTPTTGAVAPILVLVGAITALVAARGAGRRSRRVSRSRTR